MNQSTPSAETSNPRSYCEIKAIPDGSNLYYACLFEPPANKPIIIGVHALLQELYEILIECSDPGVARIKYQWWLEELDRLQQREARHPVSRYLQTQIDTAATTTHLLKHAVTAFERFLMLEQPGNIEDSLALFQQSAGQLWRFSAMATGIEQEQTLTQVEQMAASYYLLQALQLPNTFMTESCCVLPADTLAASTVVASANPDDSKLLENFSALIEQLHARLDVCYEGIDKSQRRYFRHGLILNRIASHTAREILGADSRLLTMRVSLTPIRKLLIAWWTNLRLR